MVRQPLREPFDLLDTLLHVTTTAGDLASRPLLLLPPDMPAEAAREVLDARDFDVAGVEEDPVVRFVRRDDLSGARLADRAEPLDTRCLVESRTPLSDVLDLLRGRQELMVLEHHRVVGVITRADLHSPAVALVFLAHLLAFEAALRELVPQHLGSDWFDGLTDGRQEQALRHFRQHRARNVQLGLEECLSFADWLRLARSVPGVAGSTASKPGASYVALRDALAHGRSVLDALEPQQALDLFAVLRQQVARCRQAARALPSLLHSYGTTVLSTAQGEPYQPTSPVEHVLTAYNPDSRTHPREDNVRADEGLRALLEGLGARPSRVIGHSPDRRWSEPGWSASGLSRQQAADVGRSFGQAAVFEVTSDELLVVRCRDGRLLGPVTTDDDHAEGHL